MDLRNDILISLLIINGDVFLIEMFIDELLMWVCFFVFIFYLVFLVVVVIVDIVILFVFY